MLVHALACLLVLDMIERLSDFCLGWSWDCPICHWKKHGVFLGNVLAQQGNVLQGVFDDLLACGYVAGRELVCRGAHGCSQLSPLLMFGEHHAYGPALTGDACRLHCGEQDAFLLLVMAAIGEAFDEVGSHNEDVTVDWLAGFQAVSSGFERGKHAFGHTVLFS